MRFNGDYWRPVFVMIFINLGLGVVNVFFKKILDQGTNRMVVSTYRLTIASVFLAPIAYFWEREDRPKLTIAILGQLFFSALLGTSLVQFTFLLGLQYTSVTFACAFSNIVPALTFALALLFRQEKVNMKSNNNAGKGKVLGTLVCISGALVLSLYKGTPLNKTSQIHSTSSSSSHKKTDSWVLGTILVILGVTLWSFWFILQAKIGRKLPCQYCSTMILSVFGAIQSAILSFTSERSLKMWILKDRIEIIAVVYSGVVGSGLCYVGMLWCLRKKGAVFTSAFSPFLQIFAAIFSFSFLHEQIYVGSVVGSSLVIIGLYILLWAKSKDREEPVAKQVQLSEDLEECKPDSQAVSISATCEK